MNTDSRPCAVTILLTSSAISMTPCAVQLLISTKRIFLSRWVIKRTRSIRGAPPAGCREDDEGTASIPSSYLFAKACQRFLVIRVHAEYSVQMCAPKYVLDAAVGS